MEAHVLVVNKQFLWGRGKCSTYAVVDGGRVRNALTAKEEEEEVEEGASFPSPPPPPPPTPRAEEEEGIAEEPPPFCFPFCKERDTNFPYYHIIFLPKTRNFFIACTGNLSPRRLSLRKIGLHVNVAGGGGEAPSEEGEEKVKVEERNKTMTSPSAPVCTALYTTSPKKDMCLSPQHVCSAKRTQPAWRQAAHVTYFFKRRKGEKPALNLGKQGAVHSTVLDFPH